MKLITKSTLYIVLSFLLLLCLSGCVSNGETHEKFRKFVTADKQEHKAVQLHIDNQIDKIDDEKTIPLHLKLQQKRQKSWKGRIERAEKYLKESSQ